jgi:pimeloyl-ACP methyl ester carboxylesterase
MQSLLPVESVSGLRRTLLLVYVHGFVGNDMSFGSFPAHVHNLLTSYLADTHVVHTKIYPRYKSRKNISYARDDFSNWLFPHESPTTDVVLLGHSLGGILTAEVVLLPSDVHGSHELFQHRILGTISFDTPFLGMHPSVVGTGIASLFQSKPKSSDMPISPQPQSMSNLGRTQTQTTENTASTAGVLSPAASMLSDPFSLPANDPNYNPAFPNDVILPQRAGKLENFLYFWNKHCGDMSNAISSYVTSHLEFGGCLADYPGLHKRYSAIRGLEDLDPATQPRDPQGRMIPRVRFVNYYSASTGRVKVKSRGSSQSPQGTGAAEPGSITNSASQSLAGRSPSRTPSFRSVKSRQSNTSMRSAEPRWDEELTAKDGDTPPESTTGSGERPSQYIPIRARPVSSDGGMSSGGEMIQLDPEQHIDSDEPHSTEPSHAHDPNELPSIPPFVAEPPTKPQEKDYTVKDFFKAALTAYAKELKKYQAAKQSHEKAVKAREKMIKADKKATDKATSKQAKERAKAEKERIKAEQKAAKLERQQQITQEKHQLKRRATLNQETYDKALQQDADEQGVPIEKVQNKKRDRKFCALPSKDPKTGERDQTWVRVYMEGVNEIEAHITLFTMSETYAKLVGDTAERIERWVKEAGLTGNEIKAVKK